MGIDKNIWLTERYIPLISVSVRYKYELKKLRVLKIK